MGLNVRVDYASVGGGTLGVAALKSKFEYVRSELYISMSGIRDERNRTLFQPFFTLFAYIPQIMMEFHNCAPQGLKASLQNFFFCVLVYLDLEKGSLSTKLQLLACHLLIETSSDQMSSASILST